MIFKFITQNSLCYHMNTTEHHLWEVNIGLDNGSAIILFNGFENYTLYNYSHISQGTMSHLSPSNSRKTSHSLPIKARYGVSSWVQSLVKIFTLWLLSVCSSVLYSNTIYWESIVLYLKWLPHFPGAYELTHWPWEDLHATLKIQYSSLLYWWVPSELLLIRSSDKWYRTLLMISQHWFW